MGLQIGGKQLGLMTHLPTSPYLCDLKKINTPLKDIEEKKSLYTTTWYPMEKKNSSPLLTPGKFICKSTDQQDIPEDIGLLDLEDWSLFYQTLDQSGKMKNGSWLDSLLKD